MRTISDGNRETLTLSMPIVIQEVFSSRTLRCMRHASCRFCILDDSPRKADERSSSAANESGEIENTSNVMSECRLALISAARGPRSFNNTLWESIRGLVGRHHRISNGGQLIDERLGSYLILRRVAAWLFVTSRIHTHRLDGRRRIGVEQR